MSGTKTRKKVIATGVQDFERLRVDGCFYVDKTDFIQEWWQGGDAVTLITRPRRFGKTLNMSMLNCFFSYHYAHRGELFDELKIWRNKEMQPQQGAWPSMETYLNDIMLKIMSSFDTQKDVGERTPERFYHGLVLGMLVNQSGKYDLKSNGESEYGRYDVVMEPRNLSSPAVIMEFKVYNGRNEKKLEDTAKNALKQIKEKKYDTDLLKKGIPAGQILKYGFAFRGKKCIVRKA